MPPHPAQLTAAARKFLMWDPNPAPFGVTIPCPVPVRMDLDEVRRMINTLIDTHESLRGRYSYGMDTTLVIEPESGGEVDPDRIDVRAVDIEGTDPGALMALLEQESAANNLRLDPPAGRIVTAVLFTRSTDVNILLLTVHHVAIDAIAMQVLFDDVATYTRQWEAGETIALQPESTTGAEWAEFLEEYAPSRAGELEYWLAASDSEPNLPTRAATPAAVYVDGAIEGPLAQVLFDELPAAMEASFTRILLVALGLAIEDVTGTARSIQVQKHGRYSRLRPGTDLSRTVAWLSDDYPWLLRSATGSAGARMRAAIAEYPQSPEDFTLLCWHYPDSWPRFMTFNFPKFYFNFVGDVEWIPDAHSRDHARLTVFDLSMLLSTTVVGGRRQVNYSVHSPVGGLGADRVHAIVERWRSILETAGTLDPAAAES